MKTLAELSYAIKTRRISSEEAVGRALGAADKWQPRLNAFRATYPESAALLARQIDNASEEKATKPLCGVPLAHKDMFDYPGHRSSYGSRIPQEVPAKTAATVVDRLEAAGTVTVGFLSMAEFALGPTGHNTPFRHCRNARDPERISGGSSAGSGAAVGAGIVPASLGSDTGGSVRIPASVNGITGLKPTQAQLSRAGAMLLSPSLDCVGTLARSAEDCGILMAAASGRDLRDPTALSGAFAGNGVFDGRAADPGKLRLGFPKDVSDVDSDVLIALTGATLDLERAGVAIDDVELTDVSHLHKLADVIQKAESAAVHRGRLSERGADYTPHIRRRIEPGYFVSAATYIDALSQRELWLQRFVEETLAKVDALIVPTVEETDEELLGAMPDLVGRMTRWTRWLNYLGVPALTVPCGRDRNGMPVGMQIVGRPFSEARLIEIGMLFQTLTDWHLDVPDLFSDPPRTSTRQDQIENRQHA